MKNNSKFESRLKKVSSVLRSDSGPAAKYSIKTDNQDSVQASWGSAMRR